METALATYERLMREIHDQMRQAITGLDAAALTWTPAPETSPISVLIVHTLGSELEVLRIVRGLPSDRNRDAEFVDPPTDAADLTARLDAADAALSEHLAAMTTADLEAMRERPGRGVEPGWFWMLRNLAHAREHLAHIELTKQLYQQRSSSQPG